jgi:hypothetical protein
MSSPAITYASPYASPSEAHTPIGSPAPSQILLRRVASPNHLASQRYVESPRSVPVDYSQYEQREQHEQFQYEQSQEMYGNDDPHIYDFGPNGPLPVDPQFQQQDISQNGDAGHFLYMVCDPKPVLTIACSPSATADPDARTIRSTSSSRY